jgi:hypothetical protein
LWITVADKTAPETGDLDSLQLPVRAAARWKPALNAFAITFEGRITPGTTT